MCVFELEGLLENICLRKPAFLTKRKQHNPRRQTGSPCSRTPADWHHKSWHTHNQCPLKILKGCSTPSFSPRCTHSFWQDGRVRAQDFPPLPQGLTGFLEDVPPRGAARRQIAYSQVLSHELAGIPWQRHNGLQSTRLLWICSLDFTRLPISSCAHATPCQRGQRSGSSVTSQGHFPSIFGLMCASPTCGSVLAFVRLWNPATLPLSSPAAPQQDTSDIPRS